MVSVKLGNGITNLPSFRWNTNLVSVTLGKGITSIPEYAFEGCAALERISIPDGVGSIGGSAFFNCVSLKEIVIPDGVTDIGYGAFGNCVSLKDIAIPDSVTALGDGAFSGCSALESAAIGRGVTDEDVLRGAFSYGCNGLERFLVAEDHPVWAGVDGILFTRDMTRLVRFPGGRGGAYALPAGILSIAAESFYDCTHLTAVVFSSSLLRIEDFAFSGCSGLVSVAIPDSVVMIGEYAFNGCESMTGVEIGEGVAEIGEGAFGACSALERIGVSAGNPAYLSEDGVLFSKDKRLLVQYPAGKDGAYAVPQGVVHIGVLAFSGCDGLTAVDMPDSVESIGWRAFAWCNALERVFFGAGVRNIGETNNMQWVFADDRALSAIDVAGDNPAFAGRDGVSGGLGGVG